MINFLKDIAQNTGKVILEEKKSLRVDKKSRREIVTNADIKAEEYIRKRIWEKYPEHTILGEESYDIKKDYSKEKNLWIVDPIDGTTNFAQGFREYAISIAYYHDQIAKTAVVFSPERNELFWAEEGRGAYKNNKKIHSSTKKDIKDTVIGGSFCYQTEKVDGIFDFCKDLYHYIKTMRFIGSAVLDFCLTAEGVLDGSLGYCLKPWDTAAGFLIAKEAGAITTKLDGGKWNIFHPQVVTASPHIHNELLKIFRILNLP
ncbi:inositol monophosphatase [Candidatus Gottesmanbacteria bacterium]|nr:inositol monophosphatase [Candidatus Gottesmanbacteria bacterium]